MAKILIKYESAVIKEVELKDNTVTFGRKQGNDIVIDNQAISGFHGKFVKEGNAYFVQDLGSTNGTYVNGHKVTNKSKLRHKDNIAVARHVIEFLDEPDPSAAPPTSVPSKLTATVDQKEMLRKSLGIPPGGIPKTPENQPKPEKPTQEGIIKIVSGGVSGQTEIPLKDMVTYVGTSAQAAIKIKGLFAPDLAAAITKRPEGYFLKAVKEGYPKVNGQPVQQQVLLENGALIEAGATNMVFRISNPKKN